VKVEADRYLIPVERIEGAILEIRGRKVMLDADLAALYGVSTKRMNEQVRRNAARFPEDFMFRLSADEYAALRSQIATSNAVAGSPSRDVAPRTGRGGRRYLPYAFSEHGAVRNWEW